MSAQEDKLIFDVGSLVKLSYRLYKNVTVKRDDAQIQLQVSSWMVPARHGMPV